MKYAFAMLAAGGAAGAASQAAASTTITFADPLSASAPAADISLVGGPAQFYYGAKGSSLSQHGVYANGYTGIVTTDAALPTSGEVFANTSVKTTGFVPPTPANPYGGSFALTDTYIHLAFTANGESYVGSAYIDGNSALDAITYEPGDFSVAGVPEPASWALMIGGFGLAGAALRQRRRAQPALSA